MARIKGALNARKKHNRVLKLAKGYRGARSKQYRIAKQSVMRAQASQFAGRKQKKRDMRALWITRINAAARLNGLSYSTFMHGLKLATVRCSPRWQSTTRQASPLWPRSQRQSWHNTDLNRTIKPAESVKGFRRLFLRPEEGSVFVSRIDMIFDPVIGMVRVCRGRFAELGIIQLGIDAAGLDQFCVAAPFHDYASADDQDLIRR